MNYRRNLIHGVKDACKYPQGFIVEIRLQPYKHIKLFYVGPVLWLKESERS